MDIQNFVRDKKKLNEFCFSENLIFDSDIKKMSKHWYFLFSSHSRDKDNPIKHFLFFIFFEIFHQIEIFLYLIKLYC